MISDAELDSWTDLELPCHKGVAVWNYDRCLWVWKIAPKGLEIGSPVPTDGTLIIQSEAKMLLTKINKLFHFSVFERR